MDDLISRQAAIDALDALCDRECEYSKKQRSVMCGACHLGSAFDVIEQLPSAQPERKTGRWNWTEVGRRIIQAQEYPIHVYVCSECGYGNGAVETPYCPNCGCKMER